MSRITTCNEKDPTQRCRFCKHDHRGKPRRAPKKVSEWDNVSPIRAPKKGKGRKT